MRRFLEIVCLIWALTFISFWLGSGLEWITKWDVTCRWIFTTILLFGVLAAGIIINDDK